MPVRAREPGGGLGIDGRGGGGETLDDALHAVGGLSEAREGHSPRLDRAHDVAHDLLLQPSSLHARKASTPALSARSTTSDIS